MSGPAGGFPNVPLRLSRPGEGAGEALIGERTSILADVDIGPVGCTDGMENGQFAPWLGLSAPSLDSTGERGKGSEWVFFAPTNR